LTSASDLARLLKAKRSGSGWIARCPAHDDRRESLSISEGENGKLLLKCHAGCTFDQIIKTADIEPPRTNGEDRGAPRSKPRIVATYDYRDPTKSWFFRSSASPRRTFASAGPMATAGGSGGGATHHRCPIGFRIC
jgi:putative DNA primase/helicase